MNSCPRNAEAKRWRSVAMARHCMSPEARPPLRASARSFPSHDSCAVARYRIIEACRGTVEGWRDVQLRRRSTAQSALGLLAMALVLMLAHDPSLEHAPT